MKKLKLFVLAFGLLVFQRSTAQVDTVFTSVQTSVYNFNARGYFFIAPFNMTITKVFVPGSGNQSAAILRFKAPIVNYGFTFNYNSSSDYDVLFLTQNNSSTDYISCNVVVEAGDTIGLLGWRSGSGIQYTSTWFENVDMGGASVYIQRLRYDGDLTFQSPASVAGVATDNNFNIGRVFFEFSASGCPFTTNISVTNASSSSATNGGISVTLSDPNSSIRYLRWASKEGINYPSANQEDVTGLAPGSYYLFVVTTENEPCYLGPVIVGP